MRLNSKVALLLFVSLLYVPVTDISLLAYGNPTEQKQSSVMTLTGVVTDGDSKPIPGATILVKGHPELGGTITSDKGEFLFKIPNRKDLVVQISCIGYLTIERSLDSKTKWEIIMEEDAEMLEATVVVGYGVQRKESVVGAITQVKAEELANTGTTSLTNSLAGKVPGMIVYSTSGLQGEGDATFLIRGLSSWNGNAPLVMVDGIERSMSNLSPSDIASISILKDASATAVYGAKGANGVILVTTKTGAKGKPRFTVNIEQTVNTPMFLPEHVDAATVAEMSNVAYKNGQSFGSIFSNEIIQKYADQSEPLRYPDVNWYDLILNDFSLSTNATLSLSGGSDKVRYYAGISYVHDGSIIKEIHKGTNFGYDKFTYRLNLDWDLTKTTLLEFKAGGVITTNRRFASASTSSTFFSTMYQAPTITYPAYYPASSLSQYPDPNYPDVSEDRISANQGSAYENPYGLLMNPDYVCQNQYRLMTDFLLTQKLDFITEGLSFKGKFSMTSSYYRVGKKVQVSYPQWNINWDMVDSGSPYIWNMDPPNTEYVWTNKPYSVTQDNNPTSIGYITYVEAALNYNRKFARKHTVTGLLLYNQRQHNTNATFPRRTQSYVGRVTYDFKQKYLFEANLGITGSEQFSPKYRYGVFPSLAVGYIISKEKFWKKHLYWWSTLKLRYSNGVVGSDSADARWLYYSTWSKNGKYIFEDAAANETARWETSRKQDLGIEMGFFRDRLKVNVDLYDEQRYDMLMAPIVTPLVGVSYKDVNAGALKKHGIEIELDYTKKFSNKFTLAFGAMIGLTENRITKYGDLPYAPQYQKKVNTLYGASSKGNVLVDDKYFNTIDELHGYPTFANEWTHIVPGVYKFLDYTPNGSISQDDLHIISGTVYPPMIYSFNVRWSYKGFWFKMLFTGTGGKYINYRRASIIPFYAGDNVIHKSHTNYWTPTNRNSEIPALSYGDQMYSWGGGISVYPGYDLALPGYTWKRSDYLTLKELTLLYKFNGKKLKKAIGAESLQLGIKCNNLFTFKDKTLRDVDPQRLTTATIYYPTLRAVTFNLNVAF